MHKLFFIRHGVTDDNVKHIFSGRNEPLADEGRRQATQAGQQAKAAGMTFDAIIASSWPRAIETARLIAEATGFPADKIEVSDLFIERNVGPLTDTPYDDFFGKGHIYKEIDDLPGVETIPVLQERAAQALAMIKARPENNILVVSHGGFGRAFRRAAQGVPYSDEFRDAQPHDSIPNASLIQLI
ncbi:MAG TPA: histidine phosphatase family protein [Candidatus Saccharimonadales bacterium]|jgi:broad specificity phosphatase PhoE|nr:histidine phosphatase family protein [Candidatus Saccharimonadales bacterium]